MLPDFHNSDRLLMGAEERAALVAAARRHDVTLICDETWARWPSTTWSCLPPLARWDTDNRVITIGSASKLWWGGLRVGWLRGTADLVEKLSVLRSGIDLATAVFDQLVVADLFPQVEESRAERRAWLATSRDTLMAALAEHLPAWTYPKPVGGGSIWAKLDVPSAGADGRGGRRAGGQARARPVVRGRRRQRGLPAAVVLPPAPRAGRRRPARSPPPRPGLAPVTENRLTMSL